jgi:hypothetical protein
MIRSVLVLIPLALALTAPAAPAQEARAFREPPGFERAVQIPDSVRRKVGYHHWKGAAIGGVAGAAAGLLLGLRAGDSCLDVCRENVSDVSATLIGAGVGSAFGFLVGLATPRYERKPADVHAEDAELDNTESVPDASH